jgi:hypothetical protein
VVTLGASDIDRFQLPAHRTGGTTMVITDILTGLKNKVLDAATYDSLRRNFELLEDNNQQLKERVGLPKEECELLKAENVRLTEEVTSLRAQTELAKKREEFVEKGGLAFQKNPDGTLQNTPYCPECHTRISKLGPRVYACPKCEYMHNG